MIIDKQLISFVLKREIFSDVSFENLGLANTLIPQSLSFIDDEKYMEQCVQNDNVKGILITKELADKIKEKKHLIYSDDPRWDYYSLYNYIAKKSQKQDKSIISSNAKIHKTAFVSDVNVTIGDNTSVGANVSILSDVYIGANCVIQPNTVIGSEGFEYKKTKHGILSVFHDGKVIIEDEVEIGACTCIDKGFSFRNTVIESRVKVDNLVHIAHGVQIGADSFIIASSMIAGSVTIGKNVWVSPNASIAPGLIIGDNSFISLGAVVTKNVEEGQQVTGNFAIPHDKFLSIFKSNLKNITSK